MPESNCCQEDGYACGPFADQELEIEQLKTALQKIAEYGERHMGYVNAAIDGKPLSVFAREASGVPKPR